MPEYKYKEANCESPCNICNKNTNRYPEDSGCGGLLYICSEECYQAHLLFIITILNNL